jgi:hypothetical protein
MCSLSTNNRHVKLKIFCERTAILPRTNEIFTRCFSVYRLGTTKHLLQVVDRCISIATETLDFIGTLESYTAQMRLRNKYLIHVTDVNGIIFIRRVRTDICCSERRSRTRLVIYTEIKPRMYKN